MAKMKKNLKTIERKYSLNNKKTTITGEKLKKALRKDLALFFEQSRFTL